MTKDLVAFGYAPGNYTCKCVTCGTEFVGDKRAARCQGCAERLRAIHVACEKHAQALSSTSGTAPTVTDGGLAEAGHLPDETQPAASKQNSCPKHGPHRQGECPQCDELAEARSIVAATYIPPADSDARFESWWAAGPEPWSDAKGLAQLAWNAAVSKPDETDEPPVMGAGGGLPPMPTALEAIQAHVRQIQALCDATGRDPTEWLSDNAAQGETGDRTQLHGALVRIVMEAEGCPPACSHEFHKLALASVIKIGKDALTRVPPLEPDGHRIERLENAVREAIYEVTHLSSAAWDGYYTPRIHAQAVERWRSALRSPEETERQLSPSEAASFDKTLARSPRRVPLPDHLKAPVKAGDPCPAFDVTLHEEHKGKCVYCGAPMPQVKSPGVRVETVTHEDGSKTEMHMLGDLLPDEPSPFTGQEMAADVMPVKAPENHCDDHGYEMRDGRIVCKGCGRTAAEIVQAAHDKAVAQMKASEPPKLNKYTGFDLPGADCEHCKRQLRDHGPNYECPPLNGKGDA